KFDREATAQGVTIGTVRILTVTTVGGRAVGGNAPEMVCRAVPGRGKVFINNRLAAGASGDSLIASFRAALIALKASSSFSADSSKFDIYYEVDERLAALGGPSAGLAAAVAACSAMTNRPLRRTIAIT